MIVALKNAKHLHSFKANGNSKLSVFYSPVRASSSEKYDEFEYIQRSRLPTMYFQKSLPRLPIPKLEDSCKRYLNAQQPILSEKEFQTTTKNVSEFLKNDGRKLQEELINKDAKNKSTSYISGLWFDMYLRDRKPLPVNYNPLLAFVQENDEQYNKPLVKATNLLISSARFMKSLRAGILEPEVFHMDPRKSDTSYFRTVTGLLPTSIATYGAYLFKAFPLDMSQYRNLFGSSRIPLPNKDEIRLNSESRHVVVMRRGHFYSFDLLNEKNSIRSPLEIATCLNAIMSDPRAPNDCPIGVLTGANRDQWATAREYLLKIGNEKILNKIDSASFILALDEDSVDAEYNKLLRLFLHANGTNRWFDKSFSLLMSSDGYAGINFEHSWGDGVAVLRYFKDLKNDIANKPKFHPENIGHVNADPSSVEKLNFIVDDNVRKTVDKAFIDYNEWIGRLCVDHLIIDAFGKNDCKKFGVSPDSVMQLAFQLALYKKEGHAVATYESCSTAAFRHGRTETIRSCTNQTKALCSAIVESGKSNVNDSEFKRLMIDCSKAHNILTKEAAMGQGFDRHFFALKNICENSNEKSAMPEIFNDAAYAKINHNILSTSTLSSPEVMAGGFGPVVPDGYGIGYMIQDQRLGSVITSYQDHRDATEFIKYLQSAFEDLHRILKSN